MNYSNITKCRLCKSSDLQHLFSLGSMALTGIFPPIADDDLDQGPTDLLRCNECDLVQLSQTYDLAEMYGDSYGYRSGLNQSMVKHLQGNVSYAESFVDLKDGDAVLDIGSNDGTSLNCLAGRGLSLIGMDPSAEKFKQYYNEEIDLAVDFFNKKNYLNHNGDKKPKLITTFSMFYDLEDPYSFAEDVFHILHDEGIWMLEQSYLPTMIESNSFDTICQEHLEYYSFRQIEWLANRIGFSVLDMRQNDVNGGSFQVVLSKKPSKKESISIRGAKKFETGFFSNPLIYDQFYMRINKLGSEIRQLLIDLKSENKKVYGLGASTKGNVLLQYFRIDSNLLAKIGEVNPNKYGCKTPGSNIPIVSEDLMLDEEPDFLFILPWHFKSFFLEAEKFKRFKLILPLPSLEVINER